MADCPYCDGECISFVEEENVCYVQECVRIPLKHQAKMAAEIRRLRAVAGAARITEAAWQEWRRGIAAKANEVAASVDAVIRENKKLGQILNGG